MKLRKPFDGTYRITSTFQDHQNRTPPSTAPGIDFALPSGTPVMAAADGTVYLARYGGAGGRYVRIRHEGGVVTLYAHLSQLLVPEGTQVKAGSVIGLSGNSGTNTTGPHLHFAVWDANQLRQGGNGRWVDPLPLLEE